VIEVQHLHKSYGDTVAADDVSITVQEGEIFGILGLAACVIVAAIRVALTLVVARLGYDVPLPRQFGAFVCYTLLTALALLAVGLLIAAVASAARRPRRSGSSCSSR
jgi:hypothetical protein